MSLKVESAARDTGAVLTANTVPLIVFTLAGGVVGDRFSRRLVLFVSHLGAAVTQAAVAFLLLSGNYDLRSLARREHPGLRFPGAVGVRRLAVR
ncbi:hypothetical protein [Streptomyces lydicus]|uniref:hypothetical protein n=1 Tax=Streptomyces lydicus TaxID=47763 RepID=UPI00378756E9